MKRTSWPIGMKIGAALVPVLIGLVYLTAVRAQITTPLTVNITFPVEQPGPTNRLGGTGTEQVFRLGSATPAGMFAGLNPQAGTCPGGGAPVFLKNNAAAVGANNFVYAAQVTNSNQSNVGLETLTSALCATHTPLTSVGYCPQSGQIAPGSSVETPTGLTFFFGSNGSQVIPPSQTSTIVFFTTPDPPINVAIGIAGAGVTSQGQMTGMPANETPALGPCPATITINKELACAADGPFTDGPLQTISGQQVFYRITVTNTGGTTVDNVAVNDPNLGGNLTGFTFPSGVAGRLLAGQSIQRVFGPFTATTGTAVPGTSVNGVNTATATGSLLIVGGQTLNLSVNDSVTLNVVNPQISCDKTVNGVKNLASYTPGTQLTYVLTATNAASSGANLNLTLSDPTLSALPGVNCSSPLPSTFNNVPPGQSRSITCTVSFATDAAFQAAAGGSTLNNTLTVSGVVTPGQTNICGGGSVPGGTPLTCQSQASVQLTPRPALTINKELACVPAGPFTDGPLQTISGQQVFYRITVTNTGNTQLDNVAVNDPRLSNAPLTGFTFPSGVAGRLLPGQQIQQVFGPFTATTGTAVPGTSVNGVNTATATASFLSSGAPTVSLSVNDSVTLNVVNPQISCDKTVNGVKDLSDYTSGTQLTYVLTANNAASSGANLDLTINDPTLSALPGVSCRLADNTAVTLPRTFTGVAPGQSRSITCTVSFATDAAFQAAAGGDSMLTNTVSVSGIVTPGQAFACGSSLPVGTTLSCQSTANVRLRPPDRPEICIPGQDNPNLPLGPGLPFPATSEVSDQKAGSVLFYNLYTSSSASPNTQNTVISITNTAPGAGVFVHLFFVTETCSVADVFICLSQNQTSRFLASDLDPGITGYIVAVAVDGQGCPINFNFLIGDAYVKLSSGHSANLGAEAFAAIAATPAVCNAESVTTQLRFDGVNYNRAPRVLASSNIQSPLSGNNTLLVLNRVGGDLAIGASTLGSLFGIFYDDAETPLSFSFSSNACQFRSSLSNTFPRITPRLETFIPAGRSGWLKLYSQSDIGILGAQLTANPNAGTQAGAFGGGHNLHKLTLTSSAVLTIPVFPPTTGQ